MATDPPRIGIVLSGTAPAMTLMSGVMLAFDEHNVEFDVISTTGVGGLIGMLYLAPKGGKRKEALRDLPNLFVSDWLYRFVPINFKVFHKYGPLATRFYELRKSLPKFPLQGGDRDPLKRFINDWMELWATILTPTDFEFVSKGFMGHVPLVEDLVDFAVLKAKKTAEPKTTFYLNAFSLQTRRLRIFDNDTVTPDVYNGAQAMFMLFPPVRVERRGAPGAPSEPSDLLTTGATRDPTGLQAIWTNEQERNSLWGVLALDPLAKSFWRMPTDAYDAFQLMLMNPIAALQQLMFAVYARTDRILNPPPGAPPPPATTLKLPRLFAIPQAIADVDQPKMLKWTHENALALQEAGRQAALPVAEVLAASRGDRAALEAAFASYRFSDRLLTPQRQPRSLQFLDMFKPIWDNFDTFISRISPPPEPGHQPGCATEKGGQCDCGYATRAPQSAS